eukprot:TRINITY_DN52410_c0_g1_i1.p1 TRINITY_DN52410_c0_g1~~TRINITY_DN52410_c0_g1_i1.p1  ORF type:complete len:159 (-),score=6.92 TRINITY_DN52410_c0_g1_i1:161-637(-)
MCIRDRLDTAAFRFNITTADYITSRGCSGAPDVTWGHEGSYACNASHYPLATFVRTAVWIHPRTIAGVLFGRVLCPHLSLERGVRINVPVDQLPKLCAGVTFNNCAVFYDALGGNATVLRRSKEPSCDPASSPSPDGPGLGCTTSSACVAPCSAHSSR